MQLLLPSTLSSWPWGSLLKLLTKGQKILWVSNVVALYQAVATKPRRSPERCPQKRRVVGPSPADTNSVSERSAQTTMNLQESGSANRNLAGKGQEVTTSRRCRKATRDFLSRLLYHYRVYSLHFLSLQRTLEILGVGLDSQPVPGPAATPVAFLLGHCCCHQV